MLPSKQEDSANSNLAAFKRGEGLLWRKIEAKLAPCFAEIEENCSALCVANLKATFADYRSLVQKWWEV